MNKKLNYGIITALFICTVTVLATSSKVLELSFESISDSYTSDASSYAVDGKVSGATLTKGYSGNAYRFDGTDDYVMEGYAPHLLKSLEDGFTITADVYPESSENSMTIVGYYGALNARNFQVYIDSNDKLSLLISNGETYEVLNDNNIKVTRNTWNHIVVTYAKDGNVYLKVNDESATVNHNINLVVFLRSLYIGSITEGMADQFQGTIDEVVIYDSVLSNDDLISIYGD